MRPIKFVKRHWKKLLLSGFIAAGITVFAVWWILFRVDPEFERADAANTEINQQLDQALGIDDADFDDFDDFDQAFAKGDDEPTEAEAQPAAGSSEQ